MRPVLEEKKKNYHLWIFYLVIFLICIIGMAVAVYLEFYEGENIELVFGVADEDSEEKDRYRDLKSEIPSLFTNKLEKIQEEEIQVEKITNQYDLIATAYTYEKSNEKCKLNAYIPCINIKKEKAMLINQKILDMFKTKAEYLSNFDEDDSIVYSVSYIGYLQKDILSLVIRSELREESKGQKIEIKTFNYNIKEDKEVLIDDFLKIKNVSIEDAEKKIRNEIEEIQKENDSLEQILGEDGKIYKRDYNSDRYKISNATEFFLGKNGMLYIIYAYGNIEYTSEMDSVIFI